MPNRFISPYPSARDARLSHIRLMYNVPVYLFHPRLFPSWTLKLSLHVSDLYILTFLFITDHYS